jgi:WbqC-like protein family
MLLAAHQPQYLPYPGVFDKIDQADVFVFLDAVQYVHREWQNRNRIRTPEGWMHLTIPVHARWKSRLNQVIPADPSWLIRHKRSIASLYARSRYLTRIESVWEAAALVRGHSLASINIAITSAIIAVLGIKTRLVLESELSLTDEETSTPDKRLISLCERLSCDSYLSGAGGREYLQPAEWQRSGIGLQWQEFDLLAYPQLFPGWEPNLSAVDLVLCVEKPLAHIRASRSDAFHQLVNEE